MEAIIVGVSYFGMTYDLEESMRELEALCAACDVQVKYSLTQALDKISAATYIGKGKVAELKNLVGDVDLVIFNEELSPMQIKNLTDILEIEVSDRTDLILKIFESRAKTNEAKLQVKIAKYNYLLPRLAGMNDELEGQQGGSGFRGSGEKKIELDRRLIRNQLTKAKHDLALMVKQRKTQRILRAHQDQKVVALVGYTNSGKSSLMNYFVAHSKLNDKTVLQKDMLFATLETSTRKVKLNNNKTFLLTDTVGFINQLPHHLVQAFRSTLEEVKEADLVLQVVDSSSPYYREHISVTNQVLEELGVDLNKILYVYNKIDLNKYGLVEPLDPYVFISVKEEKNMETLMKSIDQILFGDDHIVEVVLPYSLMNIVSYLLDNTHVLSYEYLENGIYLKAEVSAKMQAYLKKYVLFN
ncbi:GTPase HflX [Beduini massiliensis]|uniref:GTPase HflX n=1 Tax=Beduini massiliensis TaxID=1585974 RepID=UPI00059A807E|nr:GTPase HflX [Beduini massiliensis]